MQQFIKIFVLWRAVVEMSTFNAVFQKSIPKNTEKLYARNFFVDRVVWIIFQNFYHYKPKIRYFRGIVVIYQNDLITNSLTSLILWDMRASEGAKRIYMVQTFICLHIFGILKVLDLQKFRQIFKILTIIVNIQSVSVAVRNFQRQQNTFFGKLRSFRIVLHHRTLSEL